MHVARLKRVLTVSLTLIVTSTVLISLRCPRTAPRTKTIFPEPHLPSWIDRDTSFGVYTPIDIALTKWRAHPIATSQVISHAISRVKEEYPRECFGVTYLDSRLFTWAEYEWGNNTDFPYELLTSRRYYILSVIDLVTRRNSEILDFEAVFCLGDCIVSELKESQANLGGAYKLFEDPLPVFSLVSCKSSMNIPFPVWDSATGPFHSWGKKVDFLTDLRTSAAAWDERKTQAVFRGGQRSCVLYPDTRFRRNGYAHYVATPDKSSEASRCGRNALIYQALKSNKTFLFNVSLTSGYPIEAFKYPEAIRPPDTPTFLSTSDQAEFKYIIYAEGHCQWANRLRDLLFLGSAIIMQDVECIESYGIGLVPWIHFIPVDYWFSNLTEALLWGESHPNEVKLMIQKTNQYAHDNVTPEAILRYAEELLKQYSHLMGYAVPFRDDMRSVVLDSSVVKR